MPDARSIWRTVHHLCVLVLRALEPVCLALLAPLPGVAELSLLTAVAVRDTSALTASMRGDDLDNGVYVTRGGVALP